MTPLFAITLTITGAFVLAAALIVAWLVGRHVNRVRRRNKKAQELNRLLEFDERDCYTQNDKT